MQELIDFLDKNANYFERGSMWTVPLRIIGWLLIKVLAFLCNTAEQLYRSCFELFGLFDFSKNTEIRNLVNSIKDYSWVLIAISILAIGVTLILSNESYKPRILKNIMIAICVICCMPTMLLMIANVTNVSINNTLNYVSSSSSTTDDMIKSNVYDLKASFVKHQPNGFILENPVNVQMISADERLYNDQDWVGGNGSFIYDRITYYVLYDTDGNAYLDETKYDGLFWQLTQDTYYRYYIDYLTIIITLITLIIVFSVSAFKTIKLLYEIIVSWFLATFFSLADINGGEKIKRILQGILYSFLTMYLISFCIVLYLTIVNWLNSDFFGGDYVTFYNNALLKSIVLIFLSIAVVDGPNVIERILGIDAGLHSGMRTMMGLGATAVDTYHMGKNAIKSGTNIVKGAAKFAKNTADLGAKGISSVASWASAHKDAKNTNSTSKEDTLNDELSSSKTKQIDTNNNSSTINNNQSNTNSTNSNNKSNSSQNLVNNKTEDNKADVNIKTTDTSNIQPQNENIANESQNAQHQNSSTFDTNQIQPTKTQKSEVTSDFGQPNDINNSVSSNIQPEQQQNSEQPELNNNEILDDSVQGNYPIYSDYVNDNLIVSAKVEQQKSQEKHLLFNSFRQNYHRQKADTMNKIHSKQNKKFEKASKEYNKNQNGGDKK